MNIPSPGLTSADTARFGIACSSGLAPEEACDKRFIVGRDAGEERSIIG